LGGDVAAHGLVLPWEEHHDERRSGVVFYLHVALCVLAWLRE
jgi:hypothetical protein